MNWTLLITKPAKKELARLPKADQVRIEKALDEMAVDPFTGDIRRLSGASPAWRRRVGNYRILFRPGHRQEAHRGFRYPPPDLHNLLSPCLTIPATHIAARAAGGAFDPLPAFTATWPSTKARGRCKTCGETIRGPYHRCRRTSSVFFTRLRPFPCLALYLSNP